MSGILWQDGVYHLAAEIFLKQRIDGIDRPSGGSAGQEEIGADLILIA